ncbi:MAG: ATP-binding cassette domain-containing protein [Spirochaetaceae bacterium]|jgi:ATP-binding cassette subfamily F protein 3|nr:ATP-binding cassette domain-containing protein [Spirochaetaceae bacterium]
MRVQCSRISAAFGDRNLLDKVSILLSSGAAPSRAALAGVNGSGKSTLMQIIAGIRPPDSGDRSVEKGCRISYLPQSGMVFAGHTLREEVEGAYQHMAELLSARDQLGKQLERTTENDRTTKILLEEYHRLNEAVENSGYYRREERIEQVLSGLGFSRTDFDRECGAFSGGWQMRIALAKALLQNPNIMLLDEPTNYLDIEARTWLETWLKHFTGGYLLVSHDRYFLDVCVTEVYEIFQGVLKRYAGNYSAYEKTRDGELEILLKRYRAQQEEIAKSQALIQRFRYKASKAAMVQERIKKLEKTERIEIPESLKKISIPFPQPPHSGRIVLSLENAGKRYGSRQVLSGINLTLERKERLVVVGKNGAGKTTLLRIIAGEDGAHEGSVTYGAGVRPGYFSQNAAEALSGNETILAFLENSAPRALIPKLRDMLGAFLFRGDDVYKPLPVLSGGEKSRLALLRLLLRPLNLLILDEPTNHLDLHSKDALLDALLQFSGTVIFVSHDRAFMEALSTKTLELSEPAPEPGLSLPRGAGRSRARLFYGGYAYYLERLEREAAGLVDSAPEVPAKEPAPRNQPAPVEASAAPEAPAVRKTPAAPDGGLRPVILIKQDRHAHAGEQRELQKQRQTLLRRLRRQEEEILLQLEKLEAEKAALEAELAKKEVYSNGEKTRTLKAALAKTAAEMEAKSAEWERAAATLELQSAEEERAAGKQI